MSTNQLTGFLIILQQLIDVFYQIKIFKLLFDFLNRCAKRIDLLFLAVLDQLVRKPFLQSIQIVADCLQLVQFVLFGIHERANVAVCV